MLALGVIGIWYAAKPLLEPDDWVKVGAPFGMCGERGRPHHCVSDGDTVTIGFGANARRIRLTGFDAPETAGRCEAESAQAILAERALQEWLNRGPFEWDGGSSPPRDTYGRELREVRRLHGDGRDERLADYMIGSGLAEGEEPWARNDWCG